MRIDVQPGLGNSGAGGLYRQPSAFLYFFLLQLRPGTVSIAVLPAHHWPAARASPNAVFQVSPKLREAKGRYCAVCRAGLWDPTLTPSSHLYADFCRSTKTVHSLKSWARPRHLQRRSGGVNKRLWRGEGRRCRLASGGLCYRKIDGRQKPKRLTQKESTRIKSSSRPHLHLALP